MEITRGQKLLTLLEQRSGTESIVVLSSGEKLRVKSIAWGKDFGDTFEHVTTNAAPSDLHLPVDYFYINEVVDVLDAITGESLL